jgi:hypothetical protein
MAAPAPAPEPLVLECVVCKEPFHHTLKERRPRLLPCGHSFCEADLERLLVHGGIKFDHIKHTSGEVKVGALEVNVLLYLLAVLYPVVY